METDTKQETCQERVAHAAANRLESLYDMWDLWKDGKEEEYTEDGDRLDEFGLSFDYVAPNTFSDDQEEGYFRYQISYGGPSEEFRFYANQESEYSWSVYRIEFWFLDWWDGAKNHIGGTAADLMQEILFGFFGDEYLTHVHAQAMEERGS